MISCVSVWFTSHSVTIVSTYTVFPHIVILSPYFYIFLFLFPSTFLLFLPSYVLTPVSLHSANHSLSWCSFSLTFLTALHLLCISAPFSASSVPFSYTPSMLHSLPPHSRAPQVVMLPSCSLSLRSCSQYFSSPSLPITTMLWRLCFHLLSSPGLCEGPHHCCHPPTIRSRVPLPMSLSNPWRSGIFNLLLYFIHFLPSRRNHFHFTIYKSLSVPTGFPSFFILNFSVSVALSVFFSSPLYLRGWRLNKTPADWKRPFASLDRTTLASQRWPTSPPLPWVRADQERGLCGAEGRVWGDTKTVGLRARGSQEPGGLFRIPAPGKGLGLSGSGVAGAASRGRGRGWGLRIHLADEDFTWGGRQRQ